jgi:hypothetical protein
MHLILLHQPRQLACPQLLQTGGPEARPPPPGHPCGSPQLCDRTPKRLFGKSLCGPRARDIGVRKAPEAALSSVIRQCRATLGTPMAAARRPEVGFSNSL